MAELIVNKITKVGLDDLSASLLPADVAGDSVPSSSGIFIAMENGDVAPHTLTITAPSATATCGNLGDLAVEDITLTIPAGNTGLLTVPLGYSDANNNFSWTYDAVTSVTIGVFSLAP